MTADFNSLAAEVLHRAARLAACTDSPPGITRLFCSTAMARAHEATRQWMSAAGMSTRVDAAGNLIGRCGPAGGRRLLIGSHLDTVVDAGPYDGVLGVLLGIAAVEAMAERLEDLPWAIEVIAFSEEEGVRYATPFLGSRALVGDFRPELLQLADHDGVAMDKALQDFGLNSERIGEAAVEADSVVGFIEPHIEQGRSLEEAHAPLGVVAAIAGQSRRILQFSGPGGHAGGVPMEQRRDPVIAAARWASQVDDMARNIPGLTATIGRVEVQPSIANCIAVAALVSLDVRHSEDQTRARAVDDMLAAAEQIANTHGVDLEVASQLDDASVPMDADLTRDLAETIEEAGLEYVETVSGAGHDAGVVARRLPAAMLLLRSPGGVSHRPEERVDQADVAAGLQVLIQFIERRVARDGRHQARSTS